MPLSRCTWPSSTPTSPLRSPMLQSLGNGHHWRECIRLFARCRAQDRLREVHQVPASLRQEAVACPAANHVRAVACEGCALHPFAAWVATPDLLLNDFDNEDAQTQFEDDEPQNDAWQAVFDNRDELQKRALHPRLGAMSVHKVHRIFPPQGRLGVRHMWSLWHVGDP